MPLEGHAERLRTPLGRRDRRLLGAFALVAAAATAAGGAFAIARGDSPPSSVRCVVVTVPGTMGGVTIRRCGAAAARFCRAEARHDETVAAACRREGFAVGGSASAS